MRKAAAPVARRHPRALVRVTVLGILGLAFIGVFVLNAWVVDDAYITFRSVDNWVHGRGLTWNLGERVQVFTHPLWMLLMSAAYGLTGDFFRTSVVVSLLLCLGALALATLQLVRHGEMWRPALLVMMLLSSKAVMDYTSSGLENALSYFLAALFWFRVGVGRHDSPSPWHLASLWLVASLAFVNRHDTLLLYVPVLAWVTWRGIVTNGSRTYGPLLLATLPAGLWLLFAIWYFGFPLPNTYYAKYSTGVPLDDRLQRGVRYLVNSLTWDSAAQFMVLLGLAFALLRRQALALLGLAGVGLYYGFVVFGAIATHLSGRFFSVPLFVGLLLLARLWPSPRKAAALAAGLVVFNMWNPIAPLKMGTSWYHARKPHPNRIDANYFVHRDGPHVLLHHRGDPGVPDVEWFEGGSQFRRHSAKVYVGGIGGSPAVGFFAFAAGPEKHIVDFCGLTDPLLARLTPCNVGAAADWVSGHFYRIPPAGYLETVATGENVIEDSSLREYYQHLSAAFRDPNLWTGSRVVTIVRLNLGRYDHLRGPHPQPTNAALTGHECKDTVKQLSGPFKLP